MGIEERKECAEDDAPDGVEDEECPRNAGQRRGEVREDGVASQRTECATSEDQHDFGDGDPGGWSVLLSQCRIVEWSISRGHSINLPPGTSRTGEE